MLFDCSTMSVTSYGSSFQATPLTMTLSVTQSYRGSNRTNNLDGVEAFRVSHNGILVTNMLLDTIAL